MDEMQTPAQPVLIVDEMGKQFLAYTSRWGKFLAIVGLVLCGLLVLVAMALFIQSGKSGAETEGFGYRLRSGSSLGAAGYVLMGIVYLVLGLIYFFPSLYLLQYSDKMRLALLHNEQELLTLSFEKLKKLFRYAGITTIVIIVFYIFIILALILGFALAR